MCFLIINLYTTTMLSTSLSSQNDAFSPFSWSPPDDYCMTMLFSSTLLSSSFYLIHMTANHIQTPYTCLFSRQDTGSITLPSTVWIIFVRLQACFRNQLPLLPLLGQPGHIIDFEPFLLSNQGTPRKSCTLHLSRYFSMRGRGRKNLPIVGIVDWLQTSLDLRFWT